MIVDARRRTFEFSWDAPEFTGYAQITQYRLESRKSGPGELW